MCTVYRLYKCAHTLWRLRVPIVPNLIVYAVRIIFGGYIPYTASIGRNTQFAYGAMAVVLHDRTVIGENCMIAQGVTIGGRSGHHDVPVIGNNVFVGAGAKVLGPILIGDNAIIGANAVVTHSVEANAVVAGIPARVIRQNTTPLKARAAGRAR